MDLLPFPTVLFNSKERSASSTDARERRPIYHELTAQAKVLNSHACMSYCGITVIECNVFPLYLSLVY